MQCVSYCTTAKQTIRLKRCCTRFSKQTMMSVWFENYKQPLFDLNNKIVLTLSLTIGSYTEKTSTVLFPFTCKHPVFRYYSSSDIISGDVRSCMLNLQHTLDRGRRLALKTRRALWWVCAIVQSQQWKSLDTQYCLEALLVW